MKASRTSIRSGPPAVASGAGSLRPASAFTLIELLVVISILGLLAALTVPAIKNLGKSNIAVSAARQMLDDVGHARQLAISQHTTVYMVFTPTNFWHIPGVYPGSTWWNSLSQSDRSQVTNLSMSQLSGYAFISQGRLGDQPGQRQTDWQYLSDWQTLPENSYIAGWKFYAPPGIYDFGVNGGVYTVKNFTNTAIPFPTATNLPVNLPFIAFNYLGQLTRDGSNPSYVDEYIPLAQGSVAYGINGSAKTPNLGFVNPVDIVENPPGNSTNSMFNLIHVDALTGRARLEFQKVQ